VGLRPTTAPDAEGSTRTAGSSGDRLARRLGTADAVVIGFGSMTGAGVFAALGPAATGPLIGLVIAAVIAAVIAYCNAVASGQLAAGYPTSGTDGGSPPGGASWFARRPRARRWR
jgi:APA family basic amino acid/polyamine antiporter